MPRDRKKWDGSGCGSAVVVVKAVVVVANVVVLVVVLTVVVQVVLSVVVAVVIVVVLSDVIVVLRAAVANRLIVLTICSKGTRAGTAAILFLLLWGWRVHTKVYCEVYCGPRTQKLSVCFS